MNNKPLTAHEINNTISRARIQHRKGHFAKLEMDDIKANVIAIQDRIINEINEEIYKKYDDVIDLLEGKLGVKATYSIWFKGISINTHQYPISKKSFIYNLDSIVRQDDEYKKLIQKQEVKKDRNSTDLGLFYTRCMLLYKPEMTQEQFYQAIKEFYINT